MTSVGTAGDAFASAQITTNMVLHGGQLYTFFPRTSLIYDADTQRCRNGTSPLSSSALTEQRQGSHHPSTDPKFFLHFSSAVSCFRSHGAEPGCGRRVTQDSIKPAERDGVATAVLCPCTALPWRSPPTAFPPPSCKPPLLRDGSKPLCPSRSVL